VNARGAVALVAALGLLAGCTSRTGGEAPDPTEEASSAALELADMLTEADAAVETLNTIDATDVEGSLDEWESVATGELLREFRTGRAGHVETLTEAGTSSEGEVLASAATEFDDGAAEVLAAMRIEVTRPGADPTEKRQRMRLGMTMTDDGWKVDSVETVPYTG
jgi:Mce-associated membrane protein